MRCELLLLLLFAFTLLCGTASASSDRRQNGTEAPTNGTGNTTDPTTQPPPATTLAPSTPLPTPAPTNATEAPTPAPTLPPKKESGCNSACAATVSITVIVAVIGLIAYVYYARQKKRRELAPKVWKKSLFKNPLPFDVTFQSPAQLATEQAVDKRNLGKLWFSAPKAKAELHVMPKAVVYGCEELGGTWEYIMKPSGGGETIECTVDLRFKDNFVNSTARFRMDKDSNATTPSGKTFMIEVGKIEFASSKIYFRQEFSTHAVVHYGYAFVSEDQHSVSLAGLCVSSADMTDRGEFKMTWKPSSNSQIRLDVSQGGRGHLRRAESSMSFHHSTDIVSRPTSTAASFDVTQSGDFQPQQQQQRPQKPQKPRGGQASKENTNDVRELGDVQLQVQV